MRPARPPYLFRKFYPGMVWRANTSEKKLYLTFDDGPDPVVTPRVLDILAAHKARATFFCTGKNAEAHPAILQRTREEGHGIGNHSWDHLNGWRTATRDYIANARKCDPLLKTKLFRPPYGRITRSQARGLSEHYSLIMWDVLSWDFDASLSPESCAKKVCQGAREGSIVVFHDSAKAQKNAEAALPQVLEYLSGKGFVFERLGDQINEPLTLSST